MKNSTFLRRKLLLLVSLFILSLSGFSQQKSNWITAKNGKEIGFLEYVPANYSANPSLKYPLIIFLHGHGERGNGRSDLGNILLSGTPPRLIADGNPMTFTWNGKTETFIVISPQLNSEFGWWPNWYVDELLAYAQKTYRVDENRIFLTGLSMGGGGTWEYAGASLANAQKFAAIGVSCGACNNIDRCNLAKANLPIWAFHAKDDNSAAPYNCTVATINAINACNPAVKPYFTSWETGNHWIWGRVYDPTHNNQDPNLYEWFLAQNKGLAPNKRPVIVAPDVTTTSSLATAVLDASGSTDPDGRIIRYVWTKVSGPGGNLSALFSLDGKVNVTGLTTEGTYVFEVKVIDDRADWVTKNITLTVVAGAPGTKKPFANAGSDFTVFYPNTTAKLNGTASRDDDGTIVKWDWSQVKGPTTVTFTNNNTSTPTVNNLALGYYTFKLVVTDNNGLTAEDQVDVTVSPQNILPFAKAGPDIYIQLPTNSATLDGSASYDSDGELKAYEWSYVSGPSTYAITDATAKTTTVTGLVEGTYEFKIRVWDNWYNSTNDTLKIFVSKNPAPVNNPPVAKAGADREITLPVKSTTLDGSGSTDPDNNIRTYAWTKVSGPAAHSFSNAAAASTLADNLEAGTYEFRLTVTDAGGLSSSDNVIVKVNPRANQAPVANAGPDREITLPQGAYLDGSASSDPDNNISTYSWTKISGPASHTFTNSAAAATDVNNLAAGTYEFQLTVTDAEGLSASDIVIVKVNPKSNEAPVANAGADRTITLPTSATTLDGSTSSDPDNNIRTYAWSWVSGPSTYTIDNPPGATTGLSNLVEGTYEFRLTVTDEGGLSSSDNVTVKVNPRPNQAPVANAGADRNITAPASTTSLDGSTSSDPDNNIKTYAWSWVSGPTTYHIDNPSDATTGLSSLVEGTYVFRLTVTDEGGLSSSDDVRVIVNPVVPPDNKAPVANAGQDKSVTLPSTTTLDGSGSTDEDGSITTWLWEWVSGPASYNIVNKNSASTALNGLSVGTYVFRLTVTDNGGLTSTDEISIVVNPDPNKPPVAHAGGDITIALPIQTATLDGSASSDPEGKTLTYLWEFVTGPATYTIVNKNAASTAVSGLTTVGTYTFRLTVTDIGGLKSSDEVKVVVNPDPNKPPVANAGTDISITLPVQTVNFDGSLSSDPEGKTLTYTWSYVSGPNSYAITTPGAAKTTVSGLVEGNYEFQLLVKDPGGLTSTDRVNVTVHPMPANKLPKANAGADLTVTLPNPLIQLNGSSSTDEDGTIVSWKWSRITGPNASVITNSETNLATVTGVVPGVYTFELVVTDNRSGIGKDTVKVTVNDVPNKAPVANAGTDITITLPVQSVTLDGSASSDPEGKSLTYAWSYVSGPTPYTIASPAAAKTVVSALTDGTYTFQLQVTDAGGLTAKATVKVTVKPVVIPPNKLPTANAGVDFSVTLPNPLIQLNGSASSDQDGTIVTWKWNRITGPGALTINNSATKLATVIGAAAGVHEFELVVTDDRGGIDKDTVKVTVNPAPNRVPVAVAGKDTTIAVPANVAILDANGSFDPDGQITSARWRQIDGPRESVLATPNEITTYATALIVGVYEFELIVVDNKGAVSKDTMKVHVVNNFKFTEELALYPNPAKSVTKLRLISDTDGDAVATVVNMSGHTVKRFMVPRSQSVTIQEIPVTDLLPGVYYLHINIANKKKMVTRFVKQ